MTHHPDFDPRHGIPVQVGNGVRRIVAPNASPMTFHGTNTYLLGHSEIAVVDPGPAHEGHLQAILKAIGKHQRVTHIIVTHSHLDHSPLARPLSRATGAPVLGFGNMLAGRSEVMQRLSKTDMIGGGEGLDQSFAPDTSVNEGDTITSSDWSLDVIHTPGHLGNHICLGWGDQCFTGDHVMGWASSLVSPPDGDLTDFMASCARLSRRPWRVFYPGHGDVIHAPQERLLWLQAHRKKREAAILEALSQGPATPAELTSRVYTDVPVEQHPAAMRNVLAHLIDLHEKSRVTTSGPLQSAAKFQIFNEKPLDD